VQPLAVGAIADDDRVLAVIVGPEHVATQDDAVIHLDGHVPVDADTRHNLVVVLANVRVDLAIHFRLSPPYFAGITGSNA